MWRTRTFDYEMNKTNIGPFWEFSKQNAISLVKWSVLIQSALLFYKIYQSVSFYQWIQLLDLYPTKSITRKTKVPQKHKGSDNS